MEFLVDLWLPILIGTVVLWVMSFVSWVVLPHHFADHTKVENEEGLMEFLGQANVPPGNYMFPHASTGKEQGSPEYMDRYKAGPRGTLNIYAMPNMGLNMSLTILYFFVTILTIGYITHVACPPSDPSTTFLKVFRIAGTIGVLNYGSSGILNRIWFKARVWTHIVDGVAYGLVLGLIFGLLWPS